MVIWTQGCRHHCPNCHNPQTWDTEGGTLYSVEQLQQQIRDAQLQSGLTLSGGEPFLQVEPLLEIVRTAKEKQLNIWAYSGFTYEELLADERKKRLLVQLDVLVDGKFVNELKDTSCLKGAGIRESSMYRNHCKAAVSSCQKRMNRIRS